MDGYASSQTSNSPVPDPPPPSLTHQSSQQTTTLPRNNLRMVSLADQPTYSKFYCNCNYANPASGNCDTLSRQDLSQLYSGLHQNGSYTAGYSLGYDGRNRLTDEEDSAYPALLEREFHSLHRNVPALRRAGIDTTTIRQHFYPDGGWGWIVCGVAFLAHVLSSGFQLSYGLLLLYAIRHLGQEVATEAGWLGAVSWSVSTISAPIVIAFCRRKSTRLTAVLGGLVLALGILFASFAMHLNQVAFSYGMVVGIGATMVRESSTVMLGNYFKKRRQFVEMITMSGEGVGIALFSVILKEGVGKMGWRLGLQAITGLISFSFFMGLLYRPASLYHPQRRAIQHLKNQRKKIKEKKTHIRSPKPPFIDFAPFKSSTVRMLIITSAVSAFGIYSPIFFLSLHGVQEEYDVQDLVLLQTFLGLSVALGIVTSGSIINKIFRLGYRDICISTQYICQISVSITAISMLILSAVYGYRNLCVLSWTYGIGLGGYRYTLKMLALERIRTKYFAKAWGFIKGAESIPVIIGIPLTSFLNDSSTKYGRAGYYVCSAAAAISAILMFFVGYPSTGRQNMSKYSGNGSITSYCTAMTTECPDLLNRSYSNIARCNPTVADGGATNTTLTGHWCSPYHTLPNGTCRAISHNHRHHGQQLQQQQHNHRRRHFLHHQQPHLYSNNFRHNLMNGNLVGGGSGIIDAPVSENRIVTDSAVPNASGCYGGVQCTLAGLGGSSIGFGFGTLPTTGSVGRYQGRKLQKSLSFAFPPREMCTSDCPHGLAHNKQFSRYEKSTQPIPVPNVYQQIQPSRSRSVPEGLAYTSQYCTCPWNQNLSTAHSHRHLGSHHRSSSSISRPIQVVEQITTSV